jgi:hypothetical protein
MKNRWRKSPRGRYGRPDFDAGIVAGWIVKAPRSLLNALIVSAAALAIPSSSPLSQDHLSGRWGGQVIQAGAGNYSIVMTLAGSGGDTWYPQLSCGGRLARIGASGDYVVYTETITTGRYDPSIGKGCLDGVISVGLAGPDLGWGWFGTFRGQVFTAYARLARQ